MRCRNLDTLVDAMEASVADGSLSFFSGVISFFTASFELSPNKECLDMCVCVCVCLQEPMSIAVLPLLSLFSHRGRGVVLLLQCHRMYCIHLFQVKYSDDMEIEKLSFFTSECNRHLPDLPGLQYIQY
jgi:hypothetical protein